MNRSRRLLCQGEYMSEHRERRVAAMRSVGPVVQAVGDHVQFFLAVDVQIGALGRILATRPVGVSLS